MIGLTRMGYFVTIRDSNRSMAMSKRTSVTPTSAPEEQAIVSDGAATRQHQQIHDADPLLTSFMAAEADGSLATCVRHVIANNKATALKAR